MVASVSNIQIPLYGDKDAKLCNFRQKHKPPRAFLKLVNDDKESMDFCPINGVPLKKWNLNKPVRPISDEAKQEYSNRKEREREKKEAAAKGAILKKRRMRKKRPRLLSGGDPPTLQQQTATYAPATTSETPTTEWTTPRVERMPSVPLSHPVGHGNWATPNWVPSALAALDLHTPPTPTSIPNLTHHPAPAPMGPLEDYGAKVQCAGIPQTASASTLKTSPSPATSSGTPLSEHQGANAVAPVTSASTTQRAIPNKLYVAQAHLHQAVNKAHTTFPTSPLPNHRPSNAPACAALQQYHPRRHRLVNDLEWYSASVSYVDAHIASHGLGATGRVQGSSPDLTYMANDAYADARPATPLYSETSSGSPAMDPLLPQSGTWAESPVTPPSPYTPSQLYPGVMAVHESMRGTRHLNAACQDVVQADRRLPSPSPGTVPTLAPEPAEDHLNLMRVNGEHVLRTHPPPMIDNRFGVVARHGTEEQDPHNVHQPVYPLHSVAWSALSAVTPNLVCERRTGVHAEVNDTYYQGAPVQCQPEMPQTTSNVTKHAVQQSSYSELSQALRDDQPEPSSMKVMASGPRSLHRPTLASTRTRSERDPGSTHRASTATMLVESGMNTHLWSQKAYAPPQYPSGYYAQPHTSILSAWRTMVNHTNSTHIDHQRSKMRYSHGHA